MRKLQAVASVLVFSTLIGCNGTERARMRILQEQKSQIEARLASNSEKQKKAKLGGTRCFQVADSLASVAKDNKTLIASCEKQIEGLYHMKTADSLEIMMLVDSVGLATATARIAAEERGTALASAKRLQHALEAVFVAIAVIAVSFGAR
ncbi:MAG: hypothetical protein WC263_03410, partial [Candidatus Micrarchaeia archaeon]